MQVALAALRPRRTFQEISGRSSAQRCAAAGRPFRVQYSVRGAAAHPDYIIGR